MGTGKSRSGLEESPEEIAREISLPPNPRGAAENDKGVVVPNVDGGVGVMERDTELESSVQSVRRAVQILGAFTRETPELGVTELSRRVQLHKSTVSRLLTALKQERLVVQVQGTGRYRLGMRVVELAGIVLDGLDVVELACKPMETLAEELGETVSLAVLQDGMCVDLYTVESSSPLRVVRTSGQVAPVDASAAGQILAPASRREVAPSGPDRKPSAEPQQVSYAVVRDGWAAGVVEIAAPIRDHVGRAVASLTVSAPAARMDDARANGVVPMLQRATNAISHQLGYRDV